jgi:hypothetical protein
VLTQCRSWWLLNFKAHLARLPLDGSSCALRHLRSIDRVSKPLNLDTIACPPPGECVVSSRPRNCITLLDLRTTSHGNRLLLQSSFCFNLALESCGSCSASRLAHFFIGQSSPLAYPCKRLLFSPTTTDEFVAPRSRRVEPTVSKKSATPSASEKASFSYPISPRHGLPRESASSKTDWYVNVYYSI